MASGRLGGLALFLALSTGLVSLAPGTAWAYIPPAQFIIKNMASKRSGVRSVRVSSIVLGPGSRSTAPHFKVVTIYDAAKRTMTSQAFDSSGLELYGVEKNAEALPSSLQILYDPYDADIVEALRRQNIPVRSPTGTLANPVDGDDVISLQRWNGSVAWALGLSAGQQASKSAVSQLWIEKDSFLPVRVILGDQDLQFTNYRYSQELPYPRTTTLANRAGVEQLEEDIQSFQINPPAAMLKQMLVSDTAAAGGFTTAGASSPLKDLIRAYYAGIR